MSGEPHEGYAAVLRIPRAGYLFSAALVGRLSSATVTLSLLLAVQGTSGSFAIAGAATGVFGVANVIASPYRARLVDRYGPPRTLVTLAVVYAATLCALGWITMAAGSPAWTLLLLSGIAGLFALPLGAAMRVLWAAITPSKRMLERAYSLDAVAEEVLFTVGPLLVGLLITLTNASVALFFTAAIALVGTVGFALSGTVRAQPRRSAVAAPHRRPLRQRGFLTVLIALAGIGVVLGTVETTVPAFAEQHASVGVSGLLLAAMSVGSALGGLAYGHRTWRSSLAIRLVVLSVSLAAASALLIVAPNTPAVGGILVLVGLCLAPSTVTGYLLADALTHHTVRNEASTWINTAVNTGAAGGAALAGLLVDRSTTSMAFGVGTAIAVVATVIAATQLSRLREATAANATDSDTDSESDSAHPANL